MALRLTSLFSTIYLISGLLFSLWAAPDWLENLPKDNQFKYFVGRGIAANETQGVDLATRDAISQGVRLFGVQSQVNSEAYEDLSKTTATTRIQEISERVHLVGFEQVGLYIEKLKDGKIQAHVLYRYPTSEFENEKRRLAKSSEHKEQGVDFSIQGDRQNASNGIVEVISHPNGAQVRIDNEIFGKTPIRLIGQIGPGVHKLTLDHKEYEPLEEQIIVVPGKTQQIDKTLMKASEVLRVETVPTNAFVVLDGKPLGLSPVETRVEVGKPLKIMFSHAEAETVTKEITVERGAPRVIRENLTLKPAYVSLATSVQGAIFEVKNKTVAIPVTKLQLEPGDYTGVISKGGFKEKRVEFHLSGGEVLDLGTVDLISTTEEEKCLEESPIVIGGALKFGSSPIKSKDLITTDFEFSVEKRFIGFVGIKGAVDYKVGRDTKNKQKLNGFEVSGSIPIYYRGFFVAPEVGYALLSFEEPVTQVTMIGTVQTIGTRSTSFDTHFFGGNFGYEKRMGNHWDFRPQIGVRKYGGTSGLAGGLPIIGGMGFGYRF